MALSRRMVSVCRTYTHTHRMHLTACRPSGLLAPGMAGLTMGKICKDGWQCGRESTTMVPVAKDGWGWDMKRTNLAMSPPLLLAPERAVSMESIHKDGESTMMPISKDGWERDWESMTDEEFEGFLTNLESTTKGVSSSRFTTMEEYEAFRERHGCYIALVSKELSSLYKGIDLIAFLRARKGYDDEPIYYGDMNEDVEISHDAKTNFSSYVREAADNAKSEKQSM